MRFAGSFRKFFRYYLKSGFVFLTFSGAWMLYDGTSADLSGLGRLSVWWNSAALAIIFVSFRLPYYNYKLKCIQNDFKVYHGNLKINIKALEAYYSKHTKSEKESCKMPSPLSIISKIKSNEEEFDKLSSHYFGPYAPDRSARKKRQIMNELEIPPDANNKGV